MKKTSKRILAILLATLMLLGASAVSGAAAPMQAMEPARHLDNLNGLEDTVTIKTNPGITVDVYTWDYDLSGLVLTIQGENFSTPTDIDYDEVMVDHTIEDGKIIWNIYVYEYNDWDLASDYPVDGTVYLRVYAFKCSNFKVEYIDPDTGKEYGFYEDYKYIFDAWVDLPVTITNSYPGLGYDFTSAIPLTLNVAAQVSIPEPMEDEEQEYALFAFTPNESGYYTFKSNGAKRGQEWYDREISDWIYISGIYPWAYLYNADERNIGSSNRGYIAYPNFTLFCYLEKGETYYLAASAYPFGDFTVTVSKAKYVEPKTITINFHDFIDVDALLEGTGFTLDDVDWDYWGAISRNYNDGPNYGKLYGSEIGWGYIDMRTPDGQYLEFSFQVNYTLKQWFCVIFLGGFVWMEIVPPGGGIMDVLKLLPSMFGDFFSQGLLVGVLFILALIPMLFALPPLSLILLILGI